MKRFILSALCSGLFLVGFPAQAIVNIEDLRLDDRIQGGSGSFTVNFNGKSGNTDNLGGSANVGLQWVHNKKVELFLASYEYQEVNGQPNDESQFLHVRHTHWLQKAWAWEAYTQYESRPYEEDRMRALVGTGLRWKSLSERYQGILTASIFYEKEAVGQAERVTYELGRFNWMAEGRYALSKQAKIGVSVHFQPQVDDWENNRVIANLGLTTQVVDAIATTFRLGYRHDAQPDQTLKADDWQYSMGLNYKF